MLKHIATDVLEVAYEEAGPVDGIPVVEAKRHKGRSRRRDGNPRNGAHNAAERVPLPRRHRANNRRDTGSD